MESDIIESDTTEIVIYTTTHCPYCMMAKSLLQSKGVDWQEVDLMVEPGRRDEMISKAEGRYTVPQIFVNGAGLGGYDDISALDSDGRLDEVLGLAN